MDDKERPKVTDPGEPSEATLIVESNVLKRVRDEAQTRSEAYVIVIAGPHTGKMYKVERGETVMGRSPRTDLQLQDVGVSRSHARLTRVGDDVYVEDLQSANGTYLNGERIAVAQQLRDGDKITLGSTTVLKFTYHDKLDEDFQRQMFDAALRDGLTQAYNKKYFTNHLYSEFSFAKRHKQPLCLVMFDVDHFKNVNDTHGHPAGDAVLIKLAQIAMDSIRVEDTLARYGGEEFAIVCRGIDGAQGLVLAERLRQIVERTLFEHGGTPIPISISLGVACFPEVIVETSEQLIQATDAALYRAKNGGRNRTEMAR
jgi:diguanylate cyclase (GGDEF)-like protein